MALGCTSRLLFTHDASDISLHKKFLMDRWVHSSRVRKCWNKAKSMPRQHCWFLVAWHALIDKNGVRVKKRVRERKATVLKMTILLEEEREKEEISGAADCAQREQTLEVNVVLIKERKSKSSNTWYSYFSQKILYWNAEDLFVVEI